MGQSTGIAWTRSSFSPWIGCTRVSPGCDHCYAEALDARYKWGGAAHWGPGVPRHRTSKSTWDQVLKWNRIAGMERETGSCVDGSGRVRGAAGMAHGWAMPGFWPVFPSLCDPFDNEIPDEWRADFFRMIEQTPNLTWLLLTKRIGNARAMLPPGAWPNVWIGASIVNQPEADRDLPKLLAIVGPARRFVSYEPALGPVDFRIHLNGHCPEHDFPSGMCVDRHHPGVQRIDQIIVGGESSQGGAKARPFSIEWARSTVRQCKAAGVAVFVKQLGSTVHGPVTEPPITESFRIGKTKTGERAPFGPIYKDRAGADPAEWPEDLRIQEFPSTHRETA